MAPFAGILAGSANPDAQPTEQGRRTAATASITTNPCGDYPALPARDHDPSHREFLYRNYSRPSHLTQELQSQLDALSAHGIPRGKIFSEKISSRIRVRPQFEAALTLAREIKAHAPHCRVLFTVYEMKRLGRAAAELPRWPTTSPPTAWSWRCWPGRCPASTTRPAPAGCSSGSSRRWPRPSARASAKPPSKDSTPPPARANTAADPLSSPTTCCTPCSGAWAAGESVEQIRPDLIIPTGKRKGQNPGLASIYRALAEHEKRQAHPEAVAQAHADFAELQAG